MRGLISEVIAIVVVILGVLGARFAASSFSAWLQTQFVWPQGVCDVVAYTLIFLGIAIILSILAKGLTRFLRAIHLGWANRLFGGVFGICKYGVLVLLVVFVMDRTNDAFHYLDDSPVIKTSVLYPHCVKATNAILSLSR